MPALYLADGAAYLPVRALCRLLGLRMFCGMGLFATQQGRPRPSCTCCQDGFSRIRAIEITCSTRREMLMGYRDTPPLKSLLQS